MEYRTRFFEVNLPASLLDFDSVPIATKLITAAYVTFTLALYFVRRMCYSQLLAQGETDVNYTMVTSPIVQLIPVQIFSYPTSLVLSNLIDVEWWKFIVNLVNLVIGGSFIERNWNSSKEMFKFTIVIGSLTNLVVIAFTLLLSMVLPAIRLDLPLDGNYTVLVGFPILYKQLAPETTIFKITNVPLLSKNFRFKLLPTFVLFSMTVIQLVWFHHFSQLLSIWITFFTCWIYLRFYQVLPPALSGTTEMDMADDASDTTELDVVGDASDTFQLIYFFPGFLRPLLKPIFEGCYDLVCIRLGLIKPFRMYDIDTCNVLAEQRGAKKIVDPAEERRKQLALQVLQERMRADATSGTPGP